MIVIGITGGVASGKTFVAKQLERLGAVVLDADREGHYVLGLPDVRAALRERWGRAVFRSDGSVDRAAIARRVFARPPEGPPELAFLEALTHPHIRDRISRQLDDFRRQGVPVVVLDAPLLLKAGWERFCDRILFVEASWESRLARVRGRGWDMSELQGREAAQWPLEVKRDRSDAVVDNSGPVERTIEQVERFWQSLGVSGRE
jgi:dephospho-CoA kinase